MKSIYVSSERKKSSICQIAKNAWSNTSLFVPHKLNIHLFFINKSRKKKLRAKKLITTEKPRKKTTHHNISVNPKVQSIRTSNQFYKLIRKKKKQSKASENGEKYYGSVDKCVGEGGQHSPCLPSKRAFIFAVDTRKVFRRIEFTFCERFQNVGRCPNPGNYTTRGGHIGEWEYFAYGIHTST